MGGSDIARSNKAIMGAGLLAVLALFVAMVFAATPQAGAATIEINGDMVTISPSGNQTYTGSEIKPAVTVQTNPSDSTTKLKEDTDYTVEYKNNVNVGEATVTVTGKSSYSGTITKTFSITAKSIKDSSVVVSSIPNQKYTGSAIEPAVTIKDGTTQLVEGTDYEVSYSSNIAPGTAIAFITGKGNYNSDREEHFTIVKASIGDATIVAEDQPYTGAAVTTTVKVTFGGKELTEGTDFKISKYYKNVEIGQATVVVEGMGDNFEGEEAAYFNIYDGTLVAMCRVYNPNSGEHFYTANTAERDHLVSLGWEDEGTGWYAPETSATPVYRVYNPNAGDHHYTTNAAERDHLVSVGWKDEGTGWYSDDAETVPVLRQYNPNAKAGAHNFTTSQLENDYLVAIGWNGEGTGWYAVKAA